MTESTLRRFAAGDFVDWTGLPKGLTPDKLRRLWSGGARQIPGRLSSQPTPLRVYRCDEQQWEIHAWFDNNEELFLLTLDLPTIKGEVADLLCRLGSPDKKLHPLEGYHADAHQWIYATRGLTLFVREHSNEIARVAVYRPCSVAYYEQYLGARDKERYFARAVKADGAINV